MQTKNYSSKELTHHLGHVANSMSVVCEAARQQKMELFTTFGPYLKTIEDICKRPNQFIKSRGEGALLSALSAVYFLFEKIDGLNKNSPDFRSLVGPEIGGKFSEQFTVAQNLDLTEKCLLATLSRTWLETLFLGLNFEHQNLALMSRLAFKELRTQADKEFASFRLGDIEKFQTVVLTPIMCVAQIINQISPDNSEVSISEIVRKLKLDEMKAHGVIVRSRMYAIGTQLYDVPDNYIPILAKYA
ncbi:hypothetical protein [Paenibacillus sp. MMO-58]|uniref:hypothetical protein n=1 Tax=Paenibacillus sp. MMO-58 TaxID=3081290 RepID=UPI00301A05BB